MAILCFHHPANNKEIKTGRKKKDKTVYICSNSTFPGIRLHGEAEEEQGFWKNKDESLFFFFVKAEPEVEKKK